MFLTMEFSTMHVNVMGILVCSHFAAPYLKKTGGNIVNVVMDYDPGGLDYTLTKAAGTPLTCRLYLSR
jgi:NAD(P)-dependent dehydrogenase (short-subunit alcohol dehydrogenase family)